jgi:hypothetical protein
VKGYEGYLYPFSQKNSRWRKGTRILRVYVPDTPDTRVRRLRTQSNLRTGNSYPETPGICPDTLDILDQDPDTPGSAGDFTRILFIVVGLILMIFIGSLEHNYHVNTCRSKSLLIVRRSYTQFQNKI